MDEVSISHGSWQSASYLFGFFLHAHVFGVACPLPLFLSRPCPAVCTMGFVLHEKSLKGTNIFFSEELVLILFPLKALGAPSFKVLRVRLDRGPDLVKDIPADGRRFGLHYFSRSFQSTPFCGCPSSFPCHFLLSCSPAFKLKLVFQHLQQSWSLRETLRHSCSHRCWAQEDGKDL